MSNLICTNRVLFVIALLLTFVAESSSTQQVISNRLILKYKTFNGALAKQSAQTATAKVTQLNQKYKCKSEKQLFALKKKLKGNESIANISVLTFSGPVDIYKAAAEYDATGAFEYVEPDYQMYPQSVSITTTDPLYASQWAIYNNGNITYNGKAVSAKAGADMDIDGAWEITKGDSSVIVALLDTGLKMGSPEFTGRIWKNNDEIPGNEIDDDNNGYVDDYQGYDFGNNDTTVEDIKGHGTSIGSIIAANPDNGIGMAGVDWKCKLMVCKIQDDTGVVKISNSAIAVIYAVQNGASVINFSFGSYTYSKIMIDAINYAYTNNVLMVAGSGNDNKDTVFFPASLPIVLSVGSTDPDDKRSKAFFTDLSKGSNYGIGIINDTVVPNALDVVAPGNYITHLILGDPNVNIVGTGTSLSTAFVTGVASLLKSMNKNLTPSEITSIITSTAEDQVGDPSEDTPGYDKYYGFGRVNARKALEKVTNKVKYASHSKNTGISIREINRGCIQFNSQSAKILSVKVASLNGACLHNRIQRISNNSYNVNLSRSTSNVFFYSVVTTNGHIDEKIALLQ